MNKKKMTILCLCAGLAAVPGAAYAQETAEMEIAAEVTLEETAAEESTEAAAEKAAAEEAAAEETTAENSDTQLQAPTDFMFDPNTGEYSFQMTDERMGYYFIRVYHVDEEGNETGEYVVSSKRIKGGSTGEASGTLDVSAMPWGGYHINLVSFAPAGTDYSSPEAVTLKAHYGIGKTLERPEMLILSSGNQAELIVDWYSLSDYLYYEYLPDMKFTFYSDAECTQEVFSDTVDLAMLPDGDGYEAIPPANGSAWGFAMNQGEHLYTVTSESEQGTQEVSFSFINDIFTYTLDAGTYYVTCQALSKDEYCLDSQVSTAVEIVLTEGESTEKFTAASTELWTDPAYGFQRMYASAGAQTDRTDFAGDQEIYGELLE